MAHLDVFIDLITPPFVNMMFMITMIFGAGFILWLLSLLPMLHVLMWGILLSMGFSYFFIGMYVGGADRALYKSLLRLPRYIFWKLKVYVTALKKGKEDKWIRTERDNQISANTKSSE